MPCRSVGDQIVSGYENAVEMHKALRYAAMMGTKISDDDTKILHLAQRVLRNSYQLYRALTQGVPMVATSENVENLNYLQCAWASAAIYSNRSDFTFARRVFSENPQYRTLIKTSLETLSQTRAAEACQ
jgi:hypothetical protein